MTLLWLMEEGHRTEFTEEMELLESEGLGEVDEQARVSQNYTYQLFSSSVLKSTANGLSAASCSPL